MSPAKLVARPMAALGSAVAAPRMEESREVGKEVRLYFEMSEEMSETGRVVLWIAWRLDWNCETRDSISGMALASGVGVGAVRRWRVVGIGGAGVIVGVAVAVVSRRRRVVGRARRGILAVDWWCWCLRGSIWLPPSLILEVLVIAPALLS